ncbi:hypothetical protein F4703DRAFT_1895320 [Phycomyces blakesleeanus]
MAYYIYTAFSVLLICNTQTIRISTSDRPRYHNICALSLSCEYWGKSYLVNTNSTPFEVNEPHPFTPLSVFYDMAANMFIRKQFPEGSHSSITISNSQRVSKTVYQM